MSDIEDHLRRAVERAAGHFGPRRALQLRANAVLDQLTSDEQRRAVNAMLLVRKHRQRLADGRTLADLPDEDVLLAARIVGAMWAT